MKVFIVIYSDPYKPNENITEVFDSKEKALNYINENIVDDQNHYYIEERDVK